MTIMMTMVSINPLVAIMTTLVPTFARLAMVDVVTAAICPIELSLKYPMGRYLSFWAISIRLNEAALYDRKSTRLNSSH